MTTNEELRAHVIALETIVETALPMLLNRAEAVRLRGVTIGRLNITPAPDDERGAAVWAKAQDLADGHLAQIIARSRT